MSTYTEMLSQIETTDYDYHFWNAMRGKPESNTRLQRGRDSSTGTYAMAPVSNNKYVKALEKESLFRSIGTVVKAYNGIYRILAKDCSDMAAWIAEGEEIPLSETINDFTTNPVEGHKLAVLVKTDGNFIRDNAFNFEGYLTKRFAKNFARAEDNAFINGTGVNMPTGILNHDAGAEVALRTDAITYDDVIKLFFTTKEEYRRNGIWMMNDKTALHLRTLKDENGNYLWNHSNDTILGKRVIISEYMPDIAPGVMPIVFGDFSYYWIVERRPVSVRCLKEIFAPTDQIGHLAMEFLDGKLVRREAIQGMSIDGATA